MMKKVREISEIGEYDDREIKPLVLKDAKRSFDETAKQLKSGKKRPMTIEELDALIA